MHKQQIFLKIIHYLKLTSRFRLHCVCFRVTASSASRTPSMNPHPFELASSTAGWLTIFYYNDLDCSIRTDVNLGMLKYAPAWKATIRTLTKTM